MPFWKGRMMTEGCWKVGCVKQTNFHATFDKHVLKYLAFVFQKAGLGERRSTHCWREGKEVSTLVWDRIISECGLTWWFGGMALVRNSLWHAGGKTRRGLRGPSSSPQSTLPEVSCHVYLPFVCQVCPVSKIMRSLMPAFFTARTTFPTICPLYSLQDIASLTTQIEKLINKPTKWVPEADTLSGRQISLRRAILSQQQRLSQ